jgi:hypothetical protein
VDVEGCKCPEHSVLSRRDGLMLNARVHVEICCPYGIYMRIRDSSGSVGGKGMSRPRITDRQIREVSTRARVQVFV